jgi:hypothetical protein
MKCGDTAAASIGAISSKAETIVAVGIPIFLKISDIFPQLLTAHNFNTIAKQLGKSGI